MSRCVVLLGVAIAMLSHELLFAQISGQVTDKETKKPMPGVRVSVKDTKFGAQTDVQGRYVIRGIPSGAYTLVFSYIGFKTLERTVSSGEATVNVELELGAVSTQDIIVLGVSRKAEKVTDAPASIQTVSGAELDRVPLAGGYGQALATLKGVDFVRSGIDGVGINARGFNSAFNTRMMVITDGRFSILPGNGLPIGTFNTNIKEDIQSVEMILGPASALYGPNAHNGIVNIVSKDPRTSQGTMIAGNVGMQNYISGRFRHAGAVGDFAWKVTFEYMQARDWTFVDTVYQTALNGGNIPHFNPANPTDGIRRPNFITENKNGLNRGNAEVDILNVKHIRAEGSLYWNLPIESEFLGGRPDLIVTYGQSNNWGAGPTNAGRNYINNWLFATWQAKVVSPRLFAQVYNTWNNSGNTFPIQNVTNIMNGNIVPVPTLFGPLRDAGRVARVLNGTITADEAIQAARFAELSSRLNAEIQYNNKVGDNFNFVVGLVYQADNPRSDGTYLGDNVAFRGDGSANVGTGRLLPESFIAIPSIWQIGGAAQVDWDITGELRLVGAARYDQHQIFGGMFAPKAGLIYKVANGAVRATYGRGFVAPTVLNMFIFVPAAQIGQNVLSIVGNAEGFTLASGTKIDRLRPERVDTYEIGYKGAPLDKLFIDVSAYLQNSVDFISPAVPLYGGFTAPNTVTQIGTTNVQPQFIQSYVNFGEVQAFGIDVGIGYNLTDNISLNINYSYFNPNYDSTRRDANNNRLVFDVNRDGVVTPNELSINTPPHKFSATLNATNLFNGLLFGSISGRYVAEYDFVSGVHFAGRFGAGTRTIIPRNPNLPLSVTNPAVATFLFNRGPLGGFFSLDASVGVNILPNLMISVAANNITNTVQREMVASPPVPFFLLTELRYTIPSFY
ncbi:MAG: TonB-dependent receptor [Bacteroidota bacterium]|nr:TonB-dependent receptor [Candidatus Kapabacteria bacterium]MDW8220851.1 TonB-dependent receptor [Bacteroidota bacterium]